MPAYLLQLKDEKLRTNFGLNYAILRIGFLLVIVRTCSYHIAMYPGRNYQEREAD